MFKNMFCFDSVLLKFVSVRYKILRCYEKRANKIEFPFGNMNSFMQNILILMTSELQFFKEKAIFSLEF